MKKWCLKFLGTTFAKKRRKKKQNFRSRNDRHHWDCHGMINAGIRCLFSMIEEGSRRGTAAQVGCHKSGGGEGECIYMSYTETANKRVALI